MIGVTVSRGGLTEGPRSFAKGPLQVRGSSRSRRSPGPCTEQFPGRGSEPASKGKVPGGVACSFDHVFTRRPPIDALGQNCETKLRKFLGNKFGNMPEGDGFFE